MKEFAIFYDDGSIIEGGGDDDEVIELTFKVSKKWLNAPADGVQAVIVKDDYVCRHVLYGKDHYFMIDGGEICNENDIGPYHRKHLKGMFKYGLNLNTEQHLEIIKQIKAYDKIPRECNERKERPKP